jgi:hypothetical protein
MSGWGSPVARRLVKCLRDGALVDLLPEIPDGALLDEEVMRNWDSDHDVDADVLRKLLRNDSGEKVGPRGLRLRGARILGRLDLDQLITTIGVELLDCLLDGGITAEQAHLPTLKLVGCRAEHPWLPPLNADNLHVDGVLILQRLVINAAAADGAIRLPTAHGASLDLSDTTIRNFAGPALHADGLHSDDDVSMSDLTAEGVGEAGGIRLIDAQIGGRLNLRGATIRNANGPALIADRLHTGSDAFLDGNFCAEGAGDLGAVRLLLAEIGGNLNLAGNISNLTGPALAADSMRTVGSVLLNTGFTADGTVRLIYARIGDQVNMSGATLVSVVDSALRAEGIQTGRGMFLDQGFKAQGVSKLGSVNLVSAVIGNELLLRRAEVYNANGPAIAADGMQVGSMAAFDDGFKASGHGSDGTVRLVRTRVDGMFSIVSSNVTSTSDDPAHRWNVDGLTYFGVPQLVDMPPCASAARAAENRVAWLDLLRSKTPAYAAQPYQQLAAAYRAEGHDSDVRKILMAQRRAQIDRGALASGPDRFWAKLTGKLLGYGYQPWRALICLVVVVAVSVALALVFRAEGLIKLPIATPAGTVVATPLSTAVVTPTPLATSAPIATPTPPLTQTVAPVPVSTSPPAPEIGSAAANGGTTDTQCSPLQAIGRGLDLGAPFLPAAPAGPGRCIPSSTLAGNFLTVARWILQMMAWALAALFIAGFTGIVRKT